MPTDLDKFAITTDVHGKTTALKALGDLVAEPGFAPREWQSAAPEELFNNYKPPVADSEDLRRIIALPRRPQVVPHTERSDTLVAMMTKRFARHNPHCTCREEFNRECITTLRPIQAFGLYELGITGGLVGIIGVGHGKTLIDLLASLALQQTRGCEVAVLLVPPQLVTQMIRDYELVGQHFRMPSIIVHGKPYLKLHDGAPTLHVLPYSRLSMASATVLLEEIKPDLIISDEFQNIANFDSVRTSRVMRYFHAHPTTRFACWSGSMSDNSIKDYAHGSALALREGSPLPLDPANVDDWSRAIDPSDWPAPPGPLLELCEPGEHVQQGYHRRLVETRGVVVTQEPSISAKLLIEERTAPPIPETVASALRTLRDTWQRPDGEELVDALSVARCARELACGIYLRWKFPPINGVPQNTSDIIDWLDARKEWRKELREFLKDRREHADSPLLGTRAAMRAHGDEPYDEADRIVRGLPPLPVWEAKTWPRWRDTKPTVVYETEAVRVHDYLARDAAQWAHTNRGIVWYESVAFGVWIAEISGLPLHAGGPQAGELIGKEKGDRSIIASIKSHGTGRDGLQFIFADNLITQPSPSSVKMEQLLGRTMRVGQTAELVKASVYRHTPEMADAVDEALARATYVQRTLGSPQRILEGFMLATEKSPTISLQYDEDEDTE